MAPFWEQAQTVPLPDGTLMRIPSPEAMLIHLAAHAAGDLFRKLIFPVDIALLLQCYETELDWRRVAALAERYAVRRDLRCFLAFVAGYFGVETPVEPPSLSASRIRTLLSAPSVMQTKDGSSVCSVIEEERGKREAPLTPAAIFAAMRVDGNALVWQRWRRAQNLRESLLSLGQILFPAPATMRRFYGARSPLRIGLYYLLRPLNLAARLARARAPVRQVRDRH
jgi:hypothetical protein